MKHHAEAEPLRLWPRRSRTHLPQQKKKGMRVRLHARPAVAVALVLAFCTPSLSRSFDTPKALLINLPKHEERLRTVKEQLERAEVTYERAPAVDGRGLTIEENEREVTALARNLMTPGMIGCFLSHRNCWRRCLELNSGPIIGEQRESERECERERER
jgi:hypothetical protein